METKRRPYKLIFLLALVHTSIGILAGALGWMNQMLIVINIGVLVIWILYKKIPGNIPVLLSVCPFYLLYTTGSIIYRSEATYPIWSLGMISCFVTWFLLQKRKHVLLICMLVFIEATGYFFVMPNNFARIFSESNIEDYRFDSVDITDESGRSVKLDSFKGKVVLLDIWHTRCGSCIRKFKDLQRLHEKYRQDSAVRIFSLNMPVSTEEDTHPSTFTNKYSFGKLYFRTREESKKLPISGVPLILIMDKDFHCRYAGDLNIDWNVFIGNAGTIINKLKKES